MNNLHTFEMPALMDLLSRHTAEYTRMLHARTYTREEFENCKQAIALLQKEIESRKQAFPGPTAPPTDGTPDYID